jgi:hypothetical protein
MESIEAIGESESTTFVLPQELTSLVGRYGKHLTGSDAALAGSQGEGAGLEAQDFDSETREMLGLDDIEETLGAIDGDLETDLDGHAGHDGANGDREDDTLQVEALGTSETETDVDAGSN